MTRNFRIKLISSYVLLLLIVGAGIHGFIRFRLEHSAISSVRDKLATQAVLASRSAGLEIKDLRRDAQFVAVALGRAADLRVTIIAPDGVVTGDSEVGQEQLHEMENHGNRPEIADAFRSGKGSSSRYSSTLRTNMLYSAVLFRDLGGYPAVIRLAMPLSTLEKNYSELTAVVSGSLFVAIIVAFLMSYFISQATSRPLRRIAAIAGDIGKGNFRRRLPVDQNDELGDVTRIMNEMAERIEAQLASLGAERNRLDAILRGIGEGLMVTDEKGVISMVNPAFCGLFDIRDDIAGRSLIDISRQPALQDSFREVVKSRKERQEELSIDISGGKVIRTHWVPLLENDNLLGIVVVFHDISDLKRLENIRKDFVANVSHELRTPITVIKGYAETLLGGVIHNDSRKATQFVEIIYNHSERLALLIGDLLTLSELESGDFILQCQPTPLAAIARRAASLLEVKALEKESRIDVANIGDSIRVLGDPGRLEQVFVNLIDNAVKYSPAGSRITVKAEVEGELCRISVSDTGQGIPPQSLPRIFERFYRVDSGRARKEGGTGLGLSIVKHIIQSHGGSISVESEPGHGTTFKFSLKNAPDIRPSTAAIEC